MMLKNQEKLPEKHTSLWWLFGTAIGLSMTAVGVLLAAMLISHGQPLSGTQWGQAMANLLQVDAGSLPWFVTRAAAMTAFLLLWLSTVWGLALASKLFEPWLSGLIAYDLHETVSLLALVFTGLHVLALLFDQYTSFSLGDVLLPFTASYRPEWVGLGTLAFYVMAAVTLTAYIRKIIGVRVYRVIHMAGLGLFWEAAIHGLLTGSDSGLLATRLMYGLTGLSVIFMTTYWLAFRLQRKTRGIPVAAAAK